MSDGGLTLTEQLLTIDKTLTRLQITVKLESRV